MFIGFPSCNWKCEKECGMRVCQNSTLAESSDIEVDIDGLLDRYTNNPITKSIVCGGLEPFNSWKDLMDLIIKFRLRTDDDIVIYTGYKEDEIGFMINWLSDFPNIVIKFGRFVPNQQPHYDEVLGINLASDNQYARRISQ